MPIYSTLKNKVRYLALLSGHFKLPTDPRSTVIGARKGVKEVIFVRNWTGKVLLTEVVEIVEGFFSGLRSIIGGG